MLEDSVKEAVRAIQYLEREDSLFFMEKCVEVLTSTLLGGGKIMVAGNGGSYCDAAHFAEELTGFYREKREPLAAMVLGEPGHLTCVSNDTGFEEVFSRLVRALGKKEDVLVLLSTSGNSENIVRAATVAKQMGIFVVGFLGKGGGKVKEFVDLSFVVEGFSTSDRIQEAHMAAIHMIIEGVEKGVCKNTSSAFLASV